MNDLIAVWLAGLPMHEARAFNELALGLAFAKEKAELLPKTIDRRCAALINTKLDEAEHWMLSALRAAVDRSDSAEVPCECPLGGPYQTQCPHHGHMARGGSDGG